MTPQDALTWWRGLNPKDRLGAAWAGLALAGVGVQFAIWLDIPWPVLLLLLLSGLAWVSHALRRSPGPRRAPAGDGARRAELERRRDLAARYGHVPLSELADFRAPFAESGPPLPSPLTPEEAERARRAALVARHGHVPLTELADPTYVPAPQLPARAELPATPAIPPAPVLPPAPTLAPSAPAPIASTGPAARPIVERGRFFGRRRARGSGAIVE